MINTIIDYQKLNEKSLYEQFKEQLNKWQVADEKYIKENVDEEDQIEELENLQSKIDVCNEKLETLKDINDIDMERQQFYLNTLVNIEARPNISRLNKLEMMISASVLVANNKKVIDASEDEVITLLAWASLVDLEDQMDYSTYLLGNPLTAVVNKSTDMNECVNMLWNVVDYVDLYDHDNQSKEEYQALKNGCLDVVNNYNVKHTK